MGVAESASGTPASVASSRNRRVSAATRVRRQDSAIETASAARVAAATATGRAVV